MPCYQGTGLGCPVALLAGFPSKRIIVETTHLVISQYAHDATNNGRVHTSTHTTVMSIYAHAFSVKPDKKKDCKASLLRRTFKGTIQHFFFFFLYLCQFICFSMQI